jgi:ATP-dependent Clp protease ATP-binding subunit ClpA
MLNDDWSSRHLTDSARRILQQIPARAGDRGLHVVDTGSILMMALWSLLLWERKVGRIALERVGVDRFNLARDLDDLLEDKANEAPVAVNRERHLLMAKTGEPYQPWDFDALIEPLLRQAEHEALGLSHNYVGSEHLVLAIIRLAHGDLSDLLGQNALTYDRVRAAVLELLAVNH